MKHIGRQVLIVLASALLLTGCGQEIHYMTRKEKVLQIIEEKGADEVTWSDFSFLNHYNGGSGMRVECYDLGDGESLLLSGVSLKEKPWSISIIEKDGEVWLKKPDYSEDPEFEDSEIGNSVPNASESDASDPAP
jgi:hypothetical protein